MLITANLRWLEMVDFRGGMGARMGGGRGWVCCRLNGVPPSKERRLRVEGKGVRGEWRRVAEWDGWDGRAACRLETWVKRGKVRL